MKFEYIIQDSGISKITFEANDVIEMVNSKDGKAILEFRELLAAFTAGNYCYSFLPSMKDLVRLSNQNYANKKISFKKHPNVGFAYYIHSNDICIVINAINDLD